MSKTSSILFVVPGFSFGGTTTALISILNSAFVDNKSVDVFAISRRGSTPEALSLYDIGLNGLTTAFYSDFSLLSPKDKCRYFIIKVLKSIRWFSAFLEKIIIKTTISKIEKTRHYDFIVGFQEGLATRFTTHFTGGNKIAWIHCDYAYAYSSVNELDLYSHFSKIVCVSNFTKDGFVNKYPSLEKKTLAIHNLFDADSVLHKAKEELSNPLFDNSSFTILSVGRISAVKRFYLIPEIANRLVQMSLDFKWYIIGAAEPVELARLNDAIGLYDMSKYVSYLGSTDNPFPYFSHSDVLVMLSESEACPMVFNEAKILNLPILSSDFGSAFEFIVQGKDGFIATIEEIPQLICFFVKQPSVLESIRNNHYTEHSNLLIQKQLSELFTV